MNDLQQTLRRFNFTPKKSLGQNFLFDPVILDRIVAAGEVTANDVVLEIGPGAGSLTRCLSESAKEVIAVELDDRLIPILQYTLADHPNVKIVHGDILGIKTSEVFKTSEVYTSEVSTSEVYKVIANIPYYLTSAIIRHLLESKIKPSLIVLTVQREVAERMCAEPPEMSVLAVSVQVYGEPRIVGKIPASAFYPKADVDSAIVRIDLFKELPFTNYDDSEKFFSMVKAGFSQKRKKLKNALASGIKINMEEVEEMLKSPRFPYFLYSRLTFIHAMILVRDQRRNAAHDLVSVFL
ncbi:MAG: ribosomal RNA small subunit methyltransferase A [Chloroflexi bacterium]|nr:ribosomal RNA small subunit methyltransferase A [Chloroflexota bacterium]